MRRSISVDARVVSVKMIEQALANIAFPHIDPLVRLEKAVHAILSRAERCDVLPREGSGWLLCKWHEGFLP